MVALSSWLQVAEEMVVRSKRIVTMIVNFRKSLLFIED